MITDARVLQAEFIPKEVKHREGEVTHLSSALHPIMDGEPADPAFLYGPSGVGKTCIAQFTVERLRENVVDLNYLNQGESPAVHGGRESDTPRHKPRSTLIQGYPL